MIKSCPFCGSEPKFEGRLTPFGFSQDRIRFGCDDQFCRFKPKTDWVDAMVVVGHQETIDVENKKKLMIEHWNKRAL